METWNRWSETSLSGLILNRRSTASIYNDASFLIWTLSRWNQHLFLSRLVYLGQTCDTQQTVICSHCVTTNQNKVTPLLNNSPGMRKLYDICELACTQHMHICITRMKRMYPCNHGVLMGILVSMLSAERLTVQILSVTWWLNFSSGIVLGVFIGNDEATSRLPRSIVPKTFSDRTQLDLTWVTKRPPDTHDESELGENPYEDIFN